MEKKDYVLSCVKILLWKHTTKPTTTTILWLKNDTKTKVSTFSIRCVRTNLESLPMENKTRKAPFCNLGLATAKDVLKTYDFVWKDKET